MADLKAKGIIINKNTPENGKRPGKRSIFLFSPLKY
jgi:hypothetical protein